MPSEMELKHSCGIFGIWDHSEAARYAYLGLYGQQHRGQESCGITSTDGEQMYTRKGMGLVAHYFTEERIRHLAGHGAIGHVRYSTAGSSIAPNAQPIYFDTHRGPIALAHNGNLVNAEIIRQQLSARGTIFMTDSDSEIILHLIAQSPADNIIDAITDALRSVQGAFSLVILTPDMLMAVRDPYGFRPLVMGTLDDKYVFASETVAFDLLGANFIDEMKPGEMRWVDSEGYHCVEAFHSDKHHQCIFEHVYFARPDSVLFESLVHTSRTNLGIQLARETADSLDLDMIIPVPDGGIYIALGYSRESGVPFEIGLVRNHYVGRTFIEPEQGIRDFGVKIKLNPIRRVVENKRIGLVDDSIVRGTTSRKIIQMMRSAGAAEVHYLIGSPPYISPCYYGIDTPKRDKLIAANYSIKEISKIIHADSLHYLSLDGLLASVEPHSHRYCTSCFTAEYPVATTKDATAQLKLWRNRNVESD